MPGHTVKNEYSLPLPKSYIAFQDLPDAFSWANVDGKSHVTHMLNQHIPQYCGSCWAHSSMSSLADRIQIARSVGVGPQQGPPGPEINLSIQFLLNCGAQVAGSCSGGSATGAYEFIHSHSKFIPYDTCQPYLACSSNSTQGFCPYVDTTCSAMNTCKTCTNPWRGDGNGGCVEVSHIMK
jgi:cathepsin X